VPVIKSDAVQIQQIIVNLVRNTIEALATTTEQPKSLLIRSRRDGDNVVVDVPALAGVCDADFDHVLGRSVAEGVKDASLRRFAGYNARVGTARRWVAPGPCAGQICGIRAAVDFVRNRSLCTPDKSLNVSICTASSG
jgi:hypothetical protein